MNPVITTAELSDRLDEPGLLVYDCTTSLLWDEHGKVRIQSGQAAYLDPGHVPGAAYIDLQADLSDASSPLRFTLPPLDVLARSFGAKGIHDAAEVVLYGAGDFWWASRIWWMLRAVGFDRARVLEGGLRRWRAEGRALSVAVENYAAARLTCRPRPDVFVGKREVQAALGASGAVVINCLREEFHLGTAANHYGRPGRIPGSVSVPAGALVTADGSFRPKAELEALFAARGVAPGRRAIAYCGGGIAATGDAFALAALLGRSDVAVYDNSMQEWANDPALPMVTG